MQLTADEKSVLAKAAQRPTAGLELTRAEQTCVPNLQRLGLIINFGDHGWNYHPRIDLQIFKTRTDKCEALLKQLQNIPAC